MKLIVITISLLIPFLVQGGETAADQEKSLRFAGETRSYLLHIPPGYVAGKSLPVVIVLHGGGGSAEGMARITGFSKKGDLENFVVVYPRGSGRYEKRFLTWNSGNCCGYALDENVDDVGFIRALIEDLKKEISFDEKKVFATGISNGAMMAYRLACELSDKIAAIAPVAGALNLKHCNPQQPVSVVIFHGTADQHVLYNGGKPKKRADPHPRIDQSVPYAVSFWTKNNKCPQSGIKKEEKGKILTEIHNGCEGGTSVALYTIKDEGHTWPGGTKWVFWADEPTQEISATDVIWDFFSEHSKR